MFWKKKNMKEMYNQQLLKSIQIKHNEMMHQKRILQMSYEPSQDILLQSKITEVIYHLYLMEAKNRELKKEIH